MNKQILFDNAIRDNDFKKVKKLLSENTSDPSDNGDWDICMACYNGYFKIVKLLLNDDRVDPSVDLNYPIRISSENGHT